VIVLSLSTKNKEVRKVLVLISSNPATSRRPCEGIRIALGLASGGHEVSVVLTNDAPLLLTKAVEETVDGEMALKFLTTLCSLISVFLIDEAHITPLDLSDVHYATAPLSTESLSKKIAATDCFLSF